MSRDESEIPSTGFISQLDSNCLSHEFDLEQPKSDALTSACTRDRVWEPVPRDKDWERRHSLVFPFLHWARNRHRKEENVLMKEWNLTVSDSQTSSISMKITCIIFAQRKLLLPITSAPLYHFCVFLFWWPFIYSFFPVVNHKYGPIWRQCTTWCFPWPFQSGVTTAVRGALKKCQLAIKVPQTSIMSSFYESLGAAQNWAIMSTVKNVCGRPQHSLFSLIIAPCWCWSNCMCMVEHRQLQVSKLKITTASITFMGEEV